MDRKCAIIVLFGLALVSGHAIPHAHGVDLDTPLVRPAAPAVPARSVEPIQVPLPMAALEVPETGVDAADCPDGKCPAGHHGKVKSADGHFGKLWQWLTYKPAKGSCDCRRPTPYHPPLYTYFSCKESSCRATWAPPAPVVTVPAVAYKKEEPLRMPEMPKLAGAVNPLVPGSSAVLSEKMDGGAVLPSNYKTLPIRPANR